MQSGEFIPPPGWRNGVVQLRVTNESARQWQLSFSELSVSPKLVVLTNTRFMEETDMCHSMPTPDILQHLAMQQAIPNGCTAKTLPPSQRQNIGLQALAGNQSITDLADEFDVSRKFVYRQSDIAELALVNAFDPPPIDDEVLFQLPVTKAWLRQLTLGLVFTCHSPLRGVVELLGDVFDYDISLGTVFNTVQSAVAPARQHENAQDLSRVRVGAHDEIFQAGRPVLVGVDALSSYCYLLSQEEHRDADTWAIRLLEAQERGFHPDFTVADAGNSLRSAQAQVMPDVPCRSDVFHALHEFTEVSTKLENRAYDVVATCDRLQRKIARDRQRGRRADLSAIKQLNDAAKKQTPAIALADDVAWLARWLRFDVLGLAGPCHAERVALYDFIAAELKTRIPQAPWILQPLVTYLEGQRDDLLAFAAQLDDDFAKLAAEFAVPLEHVHALFAVQTMPLDCAKRWYRDAPLRHLLAERYFPLSQALDDVRRHTVRASSLVENLNSRLRSYFFLRRHLGNDYLTLLQFFLNHRRFARSQRPERVAKTPAELLTGQSHPHWLELLGYTRFTRN